MRKIDKQEVQKRLDRITELFAGMILHADEISQHRCPYRDRFDHCTAKFRCRNQKHPAADGDPIICEHDGKFDYQSAWETNPETYDRAKKKIEKIKDSAARRRAEKRDRNTRE